MSLCASDVLYTIEKISTKVITLLQASPQSEVCTQSYRPPKLQESQFWEFRDFHLGVPGQNDILVLAHGHA